ncbi:MAG: hypothetical protein JWR51_4170 [Devosia sp.]|uniref:molybdopterin-dependent oxidoreductase n=1 Tax=Devosia sp. TaxID=1871048 RepID=UPI0026331B15|nr:molybdopterin-dependent oxidoreductase [Devosia sp.]MDB5531067.1 hypothetical protein [Devosia sp.]
MREEKAGFCALCKSRCGATYIVEDGRLIGTAPAPDHPTGKSLCVKGKAAPEILYHPDRLLKPLRRTKPKTSDDPGWVEISWEQALGEIGEKLRGIRDAHGIEAIAVSTTTPSGTALSDGEEWVERLIQVSGTPNWVSTTEICNWHKDFAHAFTYGTGIQYPDYKEAELVVLWGFNPSSVWLDQATQVAEARARGAKIMVVDPRRFGFAIGANQWLRVRPGSDGILALGIMRLLLERGLYAADFVRRWTNAAFLVREDTGEFLRGADLADPGVDPQAFAILGRDGRPSFVGRHDGADAEFGRAALTGSVVVTTPQGPVQCTTAFDHLRAAAERYTLADVSRLTWIPEAEIEAAAEMIGAAKSVAYYTWTGLGQHAEATQIDRALATLMALKGSFDAPGGNIVLPSIPRNSVSGPHLLPPEQLAKTIGLADKPLGPPNQGRITAHDFYTAVLEHRPYAVRGLIGFGANLAVAHANPMRGRDALMALDFYVHCDTFENPSARYADILLPVNTAWERDALRVGFGSGLAAQEHIQLRQKMVEPAGESRSDADIAFAIAAELGLKAQFFDGDVDAGREYILAPSGITLDQLEAHPEGVRYPLAQRYRKYAEVSGDEVRGFATETGQIELYSALLARHGQPPVPTFADDELPANDDYPFVLTTAKTGYFCHSQHRQVPSLRKREPEPSVSIAASAAEHLGLETGDWTEIETQYGRARMRVKLDNSLDPRVVRASYGWWQANKQLALPGYDAFSGEGSNYNLLVGNDRLDPVSGAAAHRSQSCRIIPLAVQSDTWRGYRKMRVAALRRVADEVTAISLQPFDGGRLPDYQPGQHLVVRLPAEEGDDALIRCYSLTGPAQHPERQTYDIAVRFVPAPPDRADLPHGKMSSHLNRRLKLGDVIEVRAPTGKFVPPTVSTRPIVLVAGGIGITPFLAYLETLATLRDRPRVHLAYANRTHATEAFTDRLAALLDIIPELTVSRHWSQLEGSPPSGVSSGFIGRQDILRDEFELAPAVYFCGPPAMTGALKSALETAGHPTNLVFEEAFSSGAIDETALPQGPYSVTFVRSGKTVTWERNSGSLLDLAEAAGVKITNGCRAGQCESCEVPVLDGRTMHRVAVAHPGGSACLACQAVPTCDLLIDA